METDVAARLLAALSHEARLTVLQALVRAGEDGRSAGELAQGLSMPASSLSFHLTQLRGAGIVEAHREGRQVIYVASLGAVQALAAFFSELGGGLSPASRPQEEAVSSVLFLCTANAARSQMAAALLTRLGEGRFRAFSAGSAPAAEVHSLTRTVLRRNNHPVEGLRTRDWAEFSGPQAPPMDFVITVCDGAAGEVCPTWPGQPITAHWGVPDPLAASGLSEAEQALMFADVYKMLQTRIAIFVAQPLQGLDRLALRRRLDEIGGLARRP